MRIDRKWLMKDISCGEKSLVAVISEMLKDDFVARAEKYIGETRRWHTSGTRAMIIYTDGQNTIWGTIIV